jgi:riboflavin kinase/FMN adenylyltransferase
VALRIYRSVEELDSEFGPSALTIGNFDGVHAGHRRILRRVVETARRNGWKPSALTFHPHPTKVVAPQRAPRLLTTPEERCRLIAEEGIEQVLVLPFGPVTAHLTPEEFVTRILVARLDAKAVLIGQNFRFGHKQAGDTRMLQELGLRHGFRTEVIPAVSLRGRPISSSEVRRLIVAGHVAWAARLLERPHFVEGDVVTGRGIGTSKTVPTLNLRTEAEVLPATGVYVTRTTDLDGGRRWPSVTNVGFRPTFGGEDLSVESFVLEPLGEERPLRMRLEFLRRLRAEAKFPDAESLKAQILRDAGRARAYFRRLEKWVGAG